MAPVQAPSNYKPETAAKFVAAKQEERAVEAAAQPYSGYVRELAVVDHDGKLVLHAECPPGNTATASQVFCDFLRLSPAHGLARPHVGGPFSWFCLAAGDVFPMIAAELHRYNNAEGRKSPMAVPLELWWYPKFSSPPYADPYELLVRATQRADISLSSLCDYLQTAIPADFATSSPQRAELTRQLVHRGQIFRGWDDGQVQARRDAGGGSAAGA